MGLKREMKKEEYILKYGQAAYKKRLEQSQTWRTNNPEQVKIELQEWRGANPEKVKATHHENLKGGKYYKKMRLYEMTGLRHARSLIRRKHQKKWTPFKQIIAPESQIHHEWIPETANFRGVALVEADQHMHGFIDVIQILEGEITLLTEAEIMMEAKQ